MGQTRAWLTEPPGSGPRGGVVALMGQPKVGKSAVFNLLTGSAQRAFITAPAGPPSPKWRSQPALP